MKIWVLTAMVAASCFVSANGQEATPGTEIQSNPATGLKSSAVSGKDALITPVKKEIATPNSLQLKNRKETVANTNAPVVTEAPNSEERAKEIQIRRSATLISRQPLRQQTVSSPGFGKSLLKMVDITAPLEEDHWRKQAQYWDGRPNWRPVARPSGDPVLTHEVQGFGFVLLTEPNYSK